MIRIQLPQAEAERLEAGVPLHRRPQAPGPPPDRPAGPPGPPAPGHRRRPGHHTAAPSSAGSTPTSSAASTACGPARPRGSRRQDPRRPGRRGPPLGHRRAGRAGAGPGQLDPRRAGRPPAQDPRHPDLPLGHAAVLPQASASGPYRPTYRYLRGDPDEAGRGPGGPGRPEKKAEAGELVLLSQDEARFPMVPTLGGDAGGQGAPAGGRARGTARTCCTSSPWSTWSPAALHANTLESPPGGQAEDRQEQDPADAGGVRRPPAARRPDVPGRSEHKRVVLMIDNAPWHRGKPIDEALAENPHLEFKRLPSYSPQLNVDRAVLEDAAAAGDAQPAVRHAWPT